MHTPKVTILFKLLERLKRSGRITRQMFIRQKLGGLAACIRIRPQPRKSYLKPVAAGLVLLAAGWWGLRLTRLATVRPNSPVAAAIQSRPSSSPAEKNPSDRRDAEAKAAGVRFAEQLFWRGTLFSELNQKVWAESYPAVYHESQADPEYAARFAEAARIRESELVRATLGDPPLIADGASGRVLSAQVSGPVGRAICQGLREPTSYRYDAQGQSRPRPYYHQHRWCWKVDRFWYRSRNTFGRDVKDCVAAVVAKDDPYHEYKVLILEEAVF